MNSLVRTATLSAEPVALAAMKNWLRVPQDVVNDDNDITELIQAARVHCELISNCALVRSTFVQFLDRFPGCNRAEGYYAGSAGSGYAGGAVSGPWNRNRHHRDPQEIKIKRPPLISVQSLTFIGTDGRPYTLNPGQDFIVDIASQPGRIRPIPYTIWPLTLDIPAAVAIAFTAGYAPNASSVSAGTIAEPETSTPALNPSWQPSTPTPQYSYLIDSNGNVEVQLNAGSPSTAAGDNPPAWPAVGQQVVDGGCLWQNYGPIRGFWTPGTQYAGPWIVLDFNSNLQLLNVPTLISQTVAPYSLQVVGVEPLPWSGTVGGLTTDNGIAGAWRCLGFYNSLGDSGLSVPNSPEQQAAITVDWTLPVTATRAVKALATHWYYNREPVVEGSASKVPFNIEDMLGGVTVHDFSPTP